MSDTEFKWSVFGDLWSGYTTLPGIIFCLFHLFTLLTILHLWRFQIYRQIRALEWWPERPSPESRAASILNQFVEECRRLGPRGIAVPMADFAGRLDSHVAVYVDRLHSRVNLFLIVGVAGTFFAMFSFVMKIREGNMSVSNALEEGLMQAFPIGFFGLVWTFFGHFAAFAVEERLRKALNGAVQRAMKVRAEHLQTPFDRLASAVESLKDLQATLQQTLAPVIESFRQELKTAAMLMGERVQPLSAAVQDFHQAAAALAGPTERLAEAVDALPRSLDDLAQLQQRSAKAVDTMAATSEEIRTKLSAAAEQLASAAATIASIPDELCREMSASLARLQENFSGTWSEFSHRLSGELAPVREILTAGAGELHTAAKELAVIPTGLKQHLLKSLHELTEAVSAEISAAAKQVAEAARQLDQLCAGLGGAAAAMTEAFEKECASLAQQSAAAWRNASETFLRDVGNRAAVHWTEIRTASQEATSRLQEAARQMVTVSNAVDQILKRSLEQIYREAAQQARPHLERLERTVTYQYPQILNNLGQAAMHSSTLAGNVERVQQELKLAGDHVQWAGQVWQDAARRLEAVLASAGRDGEVARQLREIHAVLGLIEAQLRPRSQVKGLGEKIRNLLGIQRRTQ